VAAAAAARARVYGWRDEDGRLDGSGDYIAIDVGRTVVVRVKAYDGNVENVHTYVTTDVNTEVDMLVEVGLSSVYPGSSYTTDVIVVPRSVVV
jgi:hypothetical protein